MTMRNRNGCLPAAWTAVSSSTQVFEGNALITLIMMRNKHGCLPTAWMHKLPGALRGASCAGNRAHAFATYTLFPSGMDKKLGHITELEAYAFITLMMIRKPLWLFPCGVDRKFGHITELWGPVVLSSHQWWFANLCGCFLVAWTRSSGPSLSF